jgi:hypothetical protein
MLPEEQSKIEELDSEQDSSRSGLQSLDYLRELLPPEHPISAVDHYLIRQDIPLSPCQSASEEEDSQELMLKLMEQTHTILRLREELYYYKTQFFKLVAESGPPEPAYEPPKEADQKQS